MYVATGTFDHCAIEQNINYIWLPVIGLVDLLLHVAASATVVVEHCEAIYLSRLDNCHAINQLATRMRDVW